MRTIITGQGLPASLKASPMLHGGPIPPMTELRFGVGNSEEDSAGHERLSTDGFALQWGQSRASSVVSRRDGYLVRIEQEGWRKSSNLWSKKPCLLESSSPQLYKTECKTHSSRSVNRLLPLLSSSRATDSASCSSWLVRVATETEHL